MDLITDYKIIRNSFVDEFMSQVHYALLDGFQPFGMPSILSYPSIGFDGKPSYSTDYQQIMVKLYPPVAFELERKFGYGENAELGIKSKLEELGE